MRNLLSTDRFHFPVWLGFLLLVVILPGWQDSEQQPITGPLPEIGEEVVQRIQDYLIKDPVLLEQLAWDEEGLHMYPRASARDSGLAEATIFWDESPLFQKMNRVLPQKDVLRFYQEKGQERFPDDFSRLMEKFKPPTQPEPGRLDGIRIALDPGHVGGSMDLARLEKKFVRIEAGNRPEIKEFISFNEGNLALATAILLGMELEKRGATVLLTRHKEGHTAFDCSFEEWLGFRADHAEEQLGLDWSKTAELTSDGYPVRLRNGAAWYWVRSEDIHGEDSLWWMTQASMRDIYRIPFLKADFQLRARKINSFMPHLTLVLHYNVWEKNTWSSGKFLNAIDDNFSMAFIPGSFMKGELKKPEDRLAFLQKAFSDDVPESEKLSGAVVRAFEQYLQVPAIPYDTSLRYLRAASLPTQEKGVFARNLSLTRLINGPLCFGEALYQDNVLECQRLNEKVLKVPGMKTKMPTRLNDAVDAYLAGVLEYVHGD